MEALVIGGGVIGVGSAYYLTGAGCQVTLIDKGKVGLGCSYGNAGLIVPSHSIPLAAPGVPLKALRWMLNPESPFYIKPRLSWDLVRWLWGFARSCTSKKVGQAIPIIRDLSLASLELYRELAALKSFDFGFHHDGLLMVFRTKEGYEEGIREARVLAEAGLSNDVLDREAARKLEPSLLPGVRGAVLYRDDGHVTPSLFVPGLAALAERKGVQIREETEVLGFRASGRRITVVETTKGTFTPDVVILAAGSWTPQLAAQLKLRVPIQAAKGYSITFERLDFPRIPLALMEAKMAVTPMGNWLRFAGTLELAGLDFTVNRRRVEAICSAAQHYIGGTEALKMVEIWRGLRPCTPDGLPIIGRSQQFENMILAAGHAMIGLSLGPITGKLVAQMALGQQPSVDVRPLSPSRFN